MPRIGRHPLKTQGIVDEVKPQKITITTIVHIPVLGGYWEKSLDVLKLHFNSLFNNTHHPFDLMVLDNSSCLEVQNYLVQLYKEGQIQFLTLSKYNLRKTGAVDYLLSTALGEFVVLTDCDIYFLPGWLDASLKILDAFPEAGRVTALPMAGGDVTKNYKDAFNAVGKDNSIQIQKGQLIPEQYIRAHSISVGKDPDEYIKNRLRNRQDVLLSRNNIQAFLGGADLQFTIRRKALDSVLPIKIDDYKSLEGRFDPIYAPVLENKLKAKGFWELSTPEYLIHHMGNTIPYFENELPWLKEPSPVTNHSRIGRVQKSKKNLILRNRFIRRIFKYINIKSYKLLYD